MINVTSNKRCDRKGCTSLAEVRCERCQKWFCSPLHSSSYKDRERRVYLCDEHAEGENYAASLMAFIVILVLTVLFTILFYPSL